MKKKFMVLAVCAFAAFCCGSMMFAHAGTGMVSSGSNFDLFQTFMSSFANDEQNIGSISGVPAFVKKYYDINYSERNYYNKYDGATQTTVSDDLAAFYGDQTKDSYYLVGGHLDSSPSSVNISYTLDGYRDMGSNLYELYLRRNFTFIYDGKTYTVDNNKGCIYTVKKSGNSIKLYGNHNTSGDVIMHNGYSMNLDVNYRDGKVLWNTLKEARNVGGHGGGIVASFVQPDSFSESVLMGLSGTWQPIKYEGVAPMNLTWQQLSMVPLSTTASGWAENAWQAKSNDAYASLSYTYDGFYDKMRSVTTKAGAKWWMATLQPFTAYKDDKTAGILGSGPYVLGSGYGKKWDPGWIEFTPNASSFSGTRNIRDSYILPFRARYEAPNVFNFYSGGKVKSFVTRPVLVATYDDAATKTKVTRLDVKFEDENGNIVDNSTAMLHRFYRIRVYYWKDGVERNDNNLSEVDKNFDTDYKWNAASGLDQERDGTKLNMFWKLDTAIKTSAISRVDISGIELSDGSDYRLTYHWCDPIPGNVTSGDITIGTKSGDITSKDVSSDDGGKTSGDEMKVTSVDFKITPRYWSEDIMPFDYTVRMYVGSSTDSGGYGYAVGDLPCGLRTYIVSHLDKVAAATTSAEKTKLEDELYAKVLGYIHIYKDCGTKKGLIDLTKLAYDYIAKNPSYKIQDFFTIYPEELSGVVSPTDRVLIRFTLAIKDGGNSSNGVEVKVGDTKVDAVTYRKGYFYYEDGVVESEWNHQFSDPIVITKSNSQVNYVSSSSSSSSGSSGGGCNAGFGAIALLVALPFIYSRKQK